MDPSLVEYNTNLVMNTSAQFDRAVNDLGYRLIVTLIMVAATVATSALAAVLKYTYMTKENMKLYERYNKEKIDLQRQTLLCSPSASLCGSSGSKDIRPSASSSPDSRSK